MNKITPEQARNMIQDPDWNEMVVTFEKKDGKLRKMRVDPAITQQVAEKLFEGKDEGKTTNKNPHLIHVVDVDLFNDENTATERTWRAIDENRLLSIVCASGTEYTVSHDFKFVEREEPVMTDDLHYDLFDGGYIKPEELLFDPKQAEEVREAMDTIQNFLNQAQEEGVLEIG